MLSFPIRLKWLVYLKKWFCQSAHWQKRNFQASIWGCQPIRLKNVFSLIWFFYAKLRNSGMQMILQLCHYRVLMLQCADCIVISESFLEEINQLLTLFCSQINSRSSSLWSQLIHLHFPRTNARMINNLIISEFQSDPAWLDQEMGIRSQRISYIFRWYTRRSSHAEIFT